MFKETLTFIIRYIHDLHFYNYFIIDICGMNKLDFKRNRKICVMR